MDLSVRFVLAAFSLLVGLFLARAVVRLPVMINDQIDHMQSLVRLFSQYEKREWLDPVYIGMALGLVLLSLILGQFPLTSLVQGLLLLQAGLLISLALTDVRALLLPDLLVIAVALTGGVAIFFDVVPGVEWLDALIGAAAGSGLLWAIRFIFGKMRGGIEALGLGDVKLMAAGGLWVGWQGMSYVLVIGALLTVVYGVCWSLLRGEGLRRDTHLPLGFGLSLAFLILTIAQVIAFRSLP